LVVKLVDVYLENYPEDAKLAVYELMVADEILRGRFRESFEYQSPIVAGQVTPYRIDLHTQRPRVSQRRPHHGSGAEHLVLTL
jgi:predicted acyl esterase